ncbi:hypothetical protein PMIN06_008090 [Paraphaeosphaeria minitans]|uniref:CENP-V/GFA domain-containing protein n=1 Tax=Paraphaeosphaeria minitans TaxID=565426 RepID=A0A9P6KM10_9PLEO|nr:hypothetical protein PMIN01_11145 [Paraphaeosphaeria minitans]
MQEGAGRADQSAGSSRNAIYGRNCCIEYPRTHDKHVETKLATPPPSPYSRRKSAAVPPNFLHDLTTPPVGRNMAPRTLHGSCACGRNRYVVEIPQQQTQLAELRYDNTSASRHHSASPLTLWLRVPLHWYTSATFAQYPDEERSSIQRTFVSPFASHSRRQFCGYCGTQLTSWHEQTREDAEHICLTVGSLLDEDQALLGELGYLPGGESSDEDTVIPGSSRPTEAVAPSDQQPRGALWFEEIVKNTALARFKQQRGGHTSRDGSVKVEWDVVEWTEGDDADDEGGVTPSKRKIGQLDENDTEMRSA